MKSPPHPSRSRGRQSAALSSAKEQNLAASAATPGRAHAPNPSPSPHPSSRTYVLIWAALLVLLGLTWGAAEVDLGPFNTVAALGIAFFKMTLVVLYFMHVRYQSRLTWVFVAAGLIWFAIMVDLTLSDYLTRGDVTGARQTWRQSE